MRGRSGGHKVFTTARKTLYFRRKDSRAPNLWIPFLHTSVRGDDGGTTGVPFDQQIIEVGSGLAGKLLELSHSGPRALYFLPRIIGRVCTLRKCLLPCRIHTHLNTSRLTGGIRWVQESIPLGGNSCFMLKRRARSVCLEPDAGPPAGPPE